MNLPPRLAELKNSVASEHTPTRSAEDTNHGEVNNGQTFQEFYLDLLEIGDVLGKYELVGRIGRGSTSFVFLGRHSKLLFPVAVKVLEPSALMKAPGLLGQLESEAILLAQLNHPNIVRLWDLDEEGPLSYLVMEYVSGGTVADLIRTKGTIPLQFAWAIIRQSAEGLAEAYKEGIIHRDVKPGNLLLARDGHVKVADLGLAMVKNEQNWLAIECDPKDRLPMGTAAYMSPEQAAQAEMVDFRADIYSLGATLYHALTGRLPFEGRSTMEVIMKHMRFAPVDPREYVADLTDECAKVIQRMLAKDPNDRYSSYDELRLALAQAIGDRRAPRPLAESFLAFAGVKK